MYSWKEWCRNSKKFWRICRGSAASSHYTWTDSHIPCNMELQKYINCKASL